MAKPKNCLHARGIGQVIQEIGEDERNLVGIGGLELEIGLNSSVSGFIVAIHEL
jgi:hypothetical protein